MIYISHINLDDNIFNEIICMFKENMQYTQKWDQTNVLNITNLEGNSEIVKKILNLIKIIQSFVFNDKRFEFIEQIEIVQYKVGTSKAYHYDSSRNSTSATSVTYLNDNYVGGQTVIDGISIQPISGRTVYFDGKLHKHCVNHILKGTRYTITIWYGRQVNLLYD